MTEIAVRSRFLPSTQLYSARGGLGRMAEERAGRPRPDPAARLWPRVQASAARGFWETMTVFSVSHAMRGEDVVWPVNFCAALGVNLVPNHFHLSLLALGSPMLVGFASQEVHRGALRRGRMDWGELIANFGCLGLGEYAALRRAEQSRAAGEGSKAAVYGCLAGFSAALLEPWRAFVQVCMFGACVFFAGILAVFMLPMAIASDLIRGTAWYAQRAPAGDLQPEPELDAVWGTSRWSSGQLSEDDLAAQLLDQMEQWSAQTSGEGPLDVAVLNWGLAARSQRNLGHFLQRLRMTAEYQNEVARPSMVDRVELLLRTMDRDEELRGQCMELIERAVTSCDDRIILALNDLEVLLRVQRALHEEAPRAALAQLGQGLLKLEIINAHAARWCASHRFTADQVEVYLHFQVHWRSALDLPVTTSQMRYGSGVGSAALHAAGREAAAVARDPQRWQAFLAQWPPWQALLRREQVAAFARKNLPLRRLTPAQTDDLQCCFTLQPFAALKEPVVWGEGAQLRACEQNELLKWWALRGTDPERRCPFSLSDLARPQQAVEEEAEPTILSRLLGDQPNLDAAEAAM